jgi:hypothetical protein
MKTTITTKKRAEDLSMLLYGEVNFICRIKIEQGEEECSLWISRLCKKAHYLLNKKKIVATVVKMLIAVITNNVSCSNFI